MWSVNVCERVSVRLNERESKIECVREIDRAGENDL